MSEHGPYWVSPYGPPPSGLRTDVSWIVGPIFARNYGKTAYAEEQMNTNPMTDPHAPEGNTDYTTGAPPNEGPRQNVTDPPIDNPMQYIDSTGEQVGRHQQVERAITAAYEAILISCPRSAERTLAVRKLQEVRMWANAAIVFDGRTYKT